MKDLIVDKAGQNVYESLSKYADIGSKSTLVVATTNVFNILNHPDYYDTLINLSKVNNIRFINKFFEKVNAKLQNGDKFIYCFETYAARRRRKPINKIPVLNWFYFINEF